MLLPGFRPPAWVKTANPMPPLPFGLYIHWPFCLSKCPYCDFNSHVADAAIDHDRWLSALLREMEMLSPRVKDASLGSIFFGGGTPSLMTPENVARLIAGARNLWPSGPDMEVTLEANPTSAEGDKFAAFREAGVNRLSLGIQALETAALKRLGRRHNVDEALSALTMADRIFARVSFDLIYARQNQSLKDWGGELQQAVTLSKGHVSLYQLTVEPRTPFFEAQSSGRLKLPGSDLSRDFYDLTQEICNHAGLPAYEISNHARAGHESRHNLGYWRGLDYLGLGPGAHSRLRGHALANEPDPQSWLKLVETRGHGLARDTRLSPLERAEELLLMGLRLTEGLDLPRLAECSGYQIAPPVIQELEDDGLVALKPANAAPTSGPRRLVVTPRGRPVLNTLIHILAAGLRKSPS